MRETGAYEEDGFTVTGLPAPVKRGAAKSDAPTAAPWEELHEFWDIPYHITQDELRELVKNQTGVVFHTEDSVHRIVGTRTIYLNQVAGMQEYGYPLDGSG